MGDPGCPFLSSNSGEKEEHYEECKKGAEMVKADFVSEAPHLAKLGSGRQTGAPVITSPGSAAGPKVRGHFELGSCFREVGGTGASPLTQTFPQLQEGGRSNLLSISRRLTPGTGLLFRLCLSLHTCTGLSGGRTFPRAMKSLRQSYCPRRLMSFKHRPLQIISLGTARMGAGQESPKASGPDPAGPLNFLTLVAGFYDPLDPEVVVSLICT